MTRYNSGKRFGPKKRGLRVVGILFISSSENRSILLMVIPACRRVLVVFCASLVGHCRVDVLGKSGGFLGV